MLVRRKLESDVVWVYIDFFTGWGGKCLLKVGCCPECTSNRECRRCADDSLNYCIHGQRRSVGRVACKTTGEPFISCLELERMNDTGWCERLWVFIKLGFHQPHSFVEHWNKEFWSMAYFLLVQAVTNPSNTVYATKRMIGRSFDDPQTAKEAQVIMWNTYYCATKDC